MPTAALDETQLEQLRSQLVEKQQELQTQVSSRDPSTKPVTLDQQSVGRVSRIDAIQQQQMAIANQHQTRQQLQHIESALQRIEAGEYGACEICGEPIAFARLQAQPATSLCIECQSASENAC